MIKYYIDSVEMHFDIDQIPIQAKIQKRNNCIAI